MVIKPHKLVLGLPKEVLTRPKVARDYKFTRGLVYEIRGGNSP